METARFPLATPGFSIYSLARMQGVRLVEGQLVTAVSKLGLGAGGVEVGAGFEAEAEGEGEREEVEVKAAGL